MQPPARVRQPRQHARPLQVLVAERLPLEEPDDEDPVVGKELDDGRAHAGGRSADAVLVLGAAVDGQFVSRRWRRVPEDVRPAGGRHLVVLVGQAPREGLDPARLPAQNCDSLQQRGIEPRAVAGTHRSGNGPLLRAATMRGSPGGRRSCASAR